MKRRIIIFGTILLAACGSSKQASNGSFVPAKHLTAQVDGSIQEWGTTDLQYDKKLKCVYSIASDENNVYVFVKSLDKAQEMRILDGGLEVWLDTESKGLNAIGVLFPLPQGPVLQTERTPFNKTQQKPDEKTAQLQSKLKLVNYNLSGFKKEWNGNQSVKGNCPVKVAIDWDEKNNLVYELAIPYAALPNEIRAKMDILTLNIVINGISMPQDDNFRGGPPPGGGGDGDFGGPPPGGGFGGPQGGDMSKMAEKTEMKVRVKLIG